MVRQHSKGALTPHLMVGLFVAFVLAACVERREARFPHVVHLTELRCGGAGEPRCLTCATCHKPTRTERLEKLPDEGLCLTCHENEPKRMRRMLHVTPERPYGEIAFNHAGHLALPKIEGQCVPCHAGVVRRDLETVPPMSQCFTCHEHENQWNDGVCTPCHQRADLERTIPETFLRHDRVFLRHHGSQAVTQEALCKSCHTESDCQSCHDLTNQVSMQDQKPDTLMTNQVHRGDFLARHSIEARSQPARCMTCHTPPDCDSCHLAQGVSGNLPAGRNPHPPEWMGQNTRSPNYHGRAARRDLISCAGCHEAGPATNCIRCHQVGGYGGNPHPSGWKSLREPSETMCRYCHGGG